MEKTGPKPIDDLVVTVTIKGEDIEVKTSEPVRYLDCLNVLATAYKAVYLSAVEAAEKVLDKPETTMVH